MATFLGDASSRTREQRLMMRQGESSTSSAHYLHHQRRLHQTYSHSQGSLQSIDSIQKQPPPPPPRQEQLLVIASPNTGHSLPAICHVDALQEKAIGYGAFGVVWAVTDPRDGQKLAIKKIPNVFQNIIAAKRAYRELNFLHRLRHENIVSIVGVLEESNFPHEIYLLCDLMQTDLHKIIVSPQSLSVDHVKIFLYQILRGLKFLHSANILHRDIKPGNLLVNSDCKLKICDFGLARLHDPNSAGGKFLTLEVVTQYYRAPELLMGAQEYTEAIDIWSAGCILAELLSRSILFQASSPLSQLDLILDLLGTPDPSDLLTACTAARRHVLRLPKRQPKLASKLWQTSRTVSEEGLHLLQQLLRFNPKHRISAAAALSHPYLSGARIRYHSCMCTCCNRGSESIDSGTPASPRRYEHASDFAEPVHLPSAPGEIDGRLAQEATVTDSKEAAARLQELARQINSADSRNLCAPLRINRRAVNYRAFVKSAVAQVSERAPSPHRWEKH
ncbi:hypothetical protein BOX15_Mlig004887g1 [Macrostomum lignano]|uniref:Mitogen-activated protein kinase n=2 Tax=Macrostomum lignano TaxID=282301 RepID=A0A267EXN8_9PLAT|nr:hypothetical protein BOX15_Mlig004887g1 [Macrostomum lignano]